MNTDKLMGQFDPFGSVPQENLQGEQKEWIDSLQSCDWDARVGKKIETFWLKTENGDLFSHVYEWFLDCDNVRFIYWSPNPRVADPIVDFKVEELEEESIFVPVKRKHLKNKKKYQHLLE